MNTLRIDDAPTYADIDWAPFSGGELEAPRPKVLCAACREKRVAGVQPAAKQALCFECYRAEGEKHRRLKAAAELLTASEARFQTALPFEPVNVSRLQQLKAERQASRTEAAKAGDYAQRRVRAQMDARHALTRIFQGLKARRLVDAPAGRGVTNMSPASSIGAEALALPESWLPFVVSR